MASLVLLTRFGITFHLLQFVMSIVIVLAANILYDASDVGLTVLPFWAAVPILVAGVVGTVVLILESYKEVVFSMILSSFTVVILLIAIILPSSKINEWEDSSEAVVLGLCKQEEIYECSEIEDIGDYLLLIAIVCVVGFLISAIAVLIDAMIASNFELESNVELSDQARFATPSSVFSEEDGYLQCQVVADGDIEAVNEEQDVIVGVAREPAPMKDILLCSNKERGSVEPRPDDDDAYCDSYVTQIMNGEQDGGMTRSIMADSLPKIEDDVPDREHQYDWLNRRDSASWQRATYSRDGLKEGKDRNIVGRPRASSDRIVNGSPNSLRSRDKLLRRLGSADHDSGNASPDDEDDIEKQALPKSNTPPRTGTAQSESKRRVPLPLYLRESLDHNSAPVSPMETRSSFPYINTTEQRSMSQPKLTSMTTFNQTSREKLPLIAREEHANHDGSEGYPHNDEPSEKSFERLEISSSTSSLQLKNHKGSKSWRNESLDSNDGNMATNGFTSSSSTPSSGLLTDDNSRHVVANGHNGVVNGNNVSINGKSPTVGDDSTRGSRPYVRTRTDRSENASETSSNYDDKSSSTSEEGRSKRKWHPPWQLKKEILGHTSSVPSLCMEPTNRWFASGSGDKTVKIWDLEEGTMRLNIKAHKGGVRATSFGTRGHRFLFSAGDDRQLLCSDIEVNKVVSRYPDQTSVIYDLAIHHQSEMLLSCGRDKHIKLWDIRTQKSIKTLKGHYNTVSCLATVDSTKQIISGSHDKTLRIWDLGEGRCTQVLTGHQKSLRSIAVHDTVLSSASTERIRHWQMPQGICIKETDAEDMSINCISVSPQGVLVAAGSNGVIHLWDWKTGFKFQKIHRTSVYESQEVPICVFCAKFDSLGNKLLISDASNVIKIYKEAYTKIRRRNVAREDQGGMYQTLFGKRGSNPSLGQFSM